MRPAFQTFDYEAETDVVLPLTRKAQSAATKHTLMRPPSPMFVDKDQLVQLARVLRSIPPTVPPRVRRLSDMVIDERKANERREREKSWLTRIAAVAVLGLLMVVAARPNLTTALHQSCVSHGLCAGAAATP